MTTEIVALLGATLSALIAAFAYYGKARHERLRTTRTVLYHLLEMRHHFAATEYGIAKFPEQYLEVVNATFKRNEVVIPDAQREALVPQLRQFVRDIQAAKVEALGIQIIEPFLRALSDLARDDPLLAYDLKGKEVIKSVSSLVTVIPSIANALEVPSEEEHVKEILMTNLDDLDREVTLEVLADAIRQVARKCGPTVYVRTMGAIRRQSTTAFPSKFAARVDSMLDRVLKLAIQQAAQNHPNIGA
ncbi:hypothetical protein [Hydrogenophaga sp.]|uniref:hypothetical protein n=1 Tax=Hydrogenophaga sp. TaxID=1904254 RepID=UPI003AF9AF27